MATERTVEVDPDRPIVLVDGVCNLCNGLVQFLLERDDAGRFRFGSLQSETGRRLLDRYDLPTDELESVVVIEGDRAYTKSAAALRIAKHLGYPYSLLYRLGHVPRPIRDAVYDLVAAYRYRVFGKRDRCALPSAGVEDRFVD